MHPLVKKSFVVGIKLAPVFLALLVIYALTTAPPLATVLVLFLGVTAFWRSTMDWNYLHQHPVEQDEHWEWWFTNSLNVARLFRYAHAFLGLAVGTVVGVYAPWFIGVLASVMLGVSAWRLEGHRTETHQKLAGSIRHHSDMVGTWQIVLPTFLALVSLWGSATIDLLFT